MSKVSEQVRTRFRQGDDLRDAGLTTPADVLRFDDILYGSDPIWQTLDVYRPRQAKGIQLPVIVSVHGGAWVYGDKTRYQYYCMSLAQHGFAVVNFSYRLAPEFKFPTSLEDCNLVFTWVLDHAEEYGLDSERVFAVGDSAGGHLLGLFLALCTDPAFQKEFPFAPPPNFVPKGVALNCGYYQFTGDGDEQTAALLADLLPQRGTQRELRQIDVLSHVNSRFPPVFVMTSTGDFLQDQALMLAKVLVQHSVPFVFRFYGDALHCLEHVFHCNVRSPEGIRCNQDECDFFKELIV